MARFTQIDRHSLYPVEEWGDTLVLTPRGDAAGFIPATVNREMATVTELAQSPGIKHLIIDMSAANYFGSVVLGGLVQLSQAVRNRGGRVAICGASPDMQDILRIMKLESIWEVFPDRNTALSRIAKIPFKMKLWAWRKVGAWTAAVAVIVLAYVFYPRPNYGKIYYEQVAGLWREYQDRHDLAGEAEWDRFSTVSTKKLKPIIDHINKRALSSTWTEPERYVLYAARDHWPKALDRRDPDSVKSAQLIQACLRCSEALLEHRQPPTNLFDPVATDALAEPEVNNAQPAPESDSKELPATALPAK
ncbi:MAG: STAS domain-containing protein [Planctomycetaceae bacterium]|nr:STAS domain-containing protein [Planctomycetaceae bacterium]